MHNSRFLHINNSKPKLCKQLWTIADKHLVIIDKSIIEKLGITENSTIFLEQEIMHDNTIVMRIKKFYIDVYKMKNIKYYPNYRTNKITDKSFLSWKDNSFVFPDLCYCGHKSNEHTLSNDQCIKKEFCNCLGFLA